MITVWGRATSSNVQIVMWTLAELRLAHERINAGGQFGGTDTAEFRAMNPHGLIPVVRDGDLVLWESAAILRYLGAAYGSESFWPRDPARRAPLDMWAEWIKTTFVPAFGLRLFWPMIRTPAARRDEAALGAAIEALKPLARLLDRRLGAGPWLAGEDLTFADILTGHLLYRYQTLDFDKAETPNLDAYYARLTERPAYAEHVMVSFESLRAKE